jgi:hypothetical protein
MWTTPRPVPRGAGLFMFAATTIHDASTTRPPTTLIAASQITHTVIYSVILEPVVVCGRSRA